VKVYLTNLIVPRDASVPIDFLSDFLVKFFILSLAVSGEAKMKELVAKLLH
jgi:hypothetical protein